MIALVKSSPLILTVGEEVARGIPTLDAGAAYTSYLHSQVGAFPEKPLSDFVTAVASMVNPRNKKYAGQTFEYVDLREIDDIYGQVLSLRVLPASRIGSTKHRFQKWDILFAKIMPSLLNKKIALVTQDVSNAVASTEFYVLRLKPESGLNLFYLFRALRSDHFTRQAVANVTGATGRQRISLPQLLSLRIVVPPREVQEQVAQVVEQEMTLRALAAETARRSDDIALSVLGSTTIRTMREG